MIVVVVVAVAVVAFVAGLTVRTPRRMRKPRWPAPLNGTMTRASDGRVWQWNAETQRWDRWKAVR